MDINETSIDKVISSLEHTDEEYSKTSHRLNTCIEQITDFLKQNKEFTPDMYNEINYLIENISELHRTEFTAMYYAGIFDAFEILKKLGHIKA